MSVSTNPGHNAVARTPSAQTSRRNACVNATTANLLIEYPALVLATRLPLSDATLMTRPSPQARKCGIANRVNRSGPFTFTAHIRSIGPSSASSAENIGLMPAAFTSPCTPPNRATVAATKPSALSTLSAS